jgi:nucleoside-diphosphate-sugar epimerase
MKIAIAGASGNLGLLLSRYLAGTSHQLILLTHTRPIPGDLASQPNVNVKKVDLGNPETLRTCCEGMDCVVSLAGVLFRGAPEKFLPITNTKYVENLVSEAAASGVCKFVLVSFLHVEGETSLDSPAKGIIPELDPVPIHARTRLAAERSLIRICAESQMRYLIVRAGVIYGRGAKLTDEAQIYLRRRMLAIWRKPTWIHLLALPDFLEVMKCGIEESSIDGILNVADDHPILLQQFLDNLADHWNYPRPFRLPEIFFSAAARMFDIASRILDCAVPLNPDILRMGMMSAVCDTSRLNSVMNYKLKYPTFREGISLCQIRGKEAT